jgi:hypothetical protein
MADEIRGDQPADVKAEEAEMTEAEMAEEAEMMARLQEEIRTLPVSDHLLYMMHSLSTLAVGRMGVTDDTVALRDLDQARMAIDAFKALTEIVEPTRPAEEMAAHRGLLSQLQLAYVAALNVGGPGESSADADTPAPAPASDAEDESDAPAEQPGEASPETGEAS